MGFLVARIIAGIMLLLALGHNPHAYYYQILRVVVCGVSVWGWVISYKKKTGPLAWAFGVFAMIFIPVIPSQFPREAWAVLDILAAIFFFASIPIGKKDRTS